MVFFLTPLGLILIWQKFSGTLESNFSNKQKEKIHAHVYSTYNRVIIGSTTLSTFSANEKCKTRNKNY